MTPITPAVVQRPSPLLRTGVIGSTMPTPMITSFPPMVYVPIAPTQPGDEQLEVDLRPTRDGRLALLAYSTREELVRCCGERQAWALLPTHDLERVRLDTGFHLILLNLEIPQEFRHG